MFDISKVKYFEPVEKLADILCQKTQNPDPLFFRIMVSYYLTKVASMMRCSIDTPDRGVIPVSMYAVNLASSGHGKGHSTNIIEEQVIHEFKERFMQETFPGIANSNLMKLATKRSIRDGTEQGMELDKITAEFETLGNLAFSFDSGTTAAVKQMRTKLLLAGAGSMNMEVDEIGSNLLSQVDVLTTFLELFDVGKVKQKLTKNTVENRRMEEIDGRTPTNLMLFGTPTKLLNGTKQEDEFISMLEIGYARRCIFGYSKKIKKYSGLSPSEIYDLLTDKSTQTYIHKFAHKLGNLADRVNFNRTLDIAKPVSLELIKYKTECEKKADALPDHKEIENAELCHRYFKALKLAGTYAFIDESMDITKDHLYSAIKLVEDSGESLKRILNRDKAHVRLAKYIAGCNTDVTHSDIADELNFYKGTDAHRASMLSMAIGWGYTNNIIIKKHYIDEIPFFSGEALKKTNLGELKVSYSTDLATGYNSQSISLDQLGSLITLKGYHWTNHHLITPRRNEENCKPGFNLIVADIDGGTGIATAEMLMSEYTYLLHTTKRHTDKAPRFRMIFPLSHVLKLDAKDFKEFSLNFFDWLPFEVDRETNQRSRKWLSQSGNYTEHNGELIDALLFIPKTKKAEVQRQQVIDTQSLTNLERWFLNNTETGNRSNQFIRYAYMLVDANLSQDVILAKIKELNDKLPNNMDELEIHKTIMVSVTKAIAKRDS